MTHYIPELDGIRAIAVLLVVTAHMHTHFWDVTAGGLGFTFFCTERLFNNFTRFKGGGGNRITVIHRFLHPPDIPDLSSLLSGIGGILRPYFRPWGVAGTTPTDVRKHAVLPHLLPGGAILSRQFGHLWS